MVEDEKGDGKTSASAKARSANRGNITLRRKEHQKAEAQVFQAEVLAWLSKTLDREVSVKDVQTGVPLCELIEKAYTGYKLGKVHRNANTVFLANENLMAFWRACEDLDVPAALAFEVAAVSDPKAILLPRTFLAAVLKCARVLHDKYSFEPPNMVIREIESEAMQREHLEKMAQDVRLRSSSATAEGQEYRPYQADMSDEIDVAIKGLCDEFEAPLLPKRVAPGCYVFGKDMAHVHNVQGTLMVYSNGKWNSLAHFFEKFIGTLVKGDDPRALLASVVGKGNGPRGPIIDEPDEFPDGPLENELVGNGDVSADKSRTCREKCSQSCTVM